MFAGSMMMPEPIMFTATMNVSWIRFIFFLVVCQPLVSPMIQPSARHSPPASPSLADDVGVELDAAVDPLLEHALHLVVEAGEAVERLLERQEVVEHRLRAFVPALARDDDADARRVDQRKRRRDAALTSSSGT